MSIASRGRAEVMRALPRRAVLNSFVVLSRSLTLFRNHRSSLSRIVRVHLQTVARESYLQRESSLQASQGMSQLKRSR